MKLCQSKRRAVGVTALLSAAIAGLVLLSSALVLFSSSQIAWRANTELLRAHGRLAMFFVEQEIRNYLNPAMEISLFIQRQVAAGQVDPNNPAQLRAVLRGALAAAPQVTDVSWSDGERVRATIHRRANGAIEMQSNNDSGESIAPELAALIAQARRSATPIWGAPSAANRNHVYALAALRHRGQLAGVLTTGVGIENLSTTVRRIGEQLGMTAFIIHQDKVLGRREVDGRMPRLSEINDPVIARFQSSKVTVRTPTGLEIRGITDPANGEDYWVLSRVNDEFGEAPWHIGIYGAKQTLDNRLRAMRDSFLLGLGVLLLAIGCALWIARKIAGPIRKLAVSAKHVSRLQLERIEPVAHSGVREIDEQADAFNQMVDGLRWFEKYMPKRLVRQLMHRRGDGFIESRIDTLTVMFTDIIGFTALSENMRPAEVAALVNAHFEIVARCIEQHGGTLDKYIGDAVMAFWGAPERQADHAQRACRAALDIAAQLTREDSPVRIKIAIHSGALLVGNIGASSRMNYTVIGDTVNTCNRIVSLCGQFDRGDKATVLTSGATAQLARADEQLQFAEVGGYEVKGRSGAVEIYALRARNKSTD